MPGRAPLTQPAPRRAPRARRAALGAGGAAAAASLTACALAPVPVAPPAPTSGDGAPPVREVAAACVGLHLDLPTHVLGHRRRGTTPETTRTAAWGDPPVVLRCGVPRLPPLPPEATVVGVEGVDWLAQQLGDGYLFTTVRRTPAVEVRVPAAYAPEVNPLVDLADAVSRLPQRE